MRRIVIVGNGIAGLTAGETLRGAGYDGEIVVVGEEQHPPYSRPALSKALLKDRDDVTSHRLPAPEIDSVDLLGVRAIGLDPARRWVELSSGSHLSYDGLVIATGTRARRLGPSGSGELTLRGLDDALALRERLDSKPAVVVVGSGPLAMEIASGCLDAGSDVTLVAKGQPMTSQLGGFLANALVTAGERRGLRVVRATEASVVSSNGTSAVVADGATVEGDLVITAVGDQPNDEWLATSGLLTNGSVVVDSRGRLTANIVAAGDIAAFPTKHGVRRVPLWTSAIDRSKTAALGLLTGDDAPEAEFQPYFWTEQFGLSVKVCGDLVFDDAPEIVDADGDSMLLRWAQPDGSATAAAVNYRIPVPKLRRMCQPAASAVV